MSSRLNHRSSLMTFFSASVRLAGEISVFWVWATMNCCFRRVRVPERTSSNSPNQTMGPRVR